MAGIQLLHMVICAPSNYTFLELGERRSREKKRKPVVILKSPLDAGLIIVCLVFGMAVIETLAVRVYIQHVGGSRAPCGWIFITSPSNVCILHFLLRRCITYKCICGNLCNCQYPTTKTQSYSHAGSVLT